MAVKWAVADGNWNSGTTWNDGVEPASGDIVYCNGHTISQLPHDVVVKSLRNDANDDYSIVGGGHFVQPMAVANVVTADIVADSGYVLLTGTSGGSITINGNVTSRTALAIDTNNSTRSHTFIVNGNVLLTDGCAIFGSTYGTFRFTIVGNLVAENSAYIHDGTRNNHATPLFTYAGAITNVTWSSVSQTITTCNGSGNWQLPTSQTITTATITGDIIANGYELIVTTLNINGSITYKSTNNTIGVRYTTLNILNPDTFVWKDISEPRSNPFIILTNAEMNNRQQYPPEDEVKDGTEYVWGEKIGTYQQPPESVVLKDYVYDNGDKIGSLENQNIVGCVTPEDVRKDVPLVGMGVVGSLVVPSVDDVREGVHFDNDSVGTLIVQGGGDRLRIADFGYYTRSTSITYIVDLTESDKPAFADCEEIVLRSLFPTLDLDNIPDKFFDDLFVQFLRYRLLVEYYRGTSINSKFTPSEPTSEIVNYANTKCEYWLNTANLFLQLWGEKYPNSVKKDRILL